MAASSRHIVTLTWVLTILAATPSTSSGDEWDFAAGDQGARIPSVTGGPSLHSETPGAVTADSAGRLVGSEPWVLLDESTRPPLPGLALHVSAWVRVDRPEPWAAMVSALEDNGEFERGFVLGTDASGTRFNFGVAGQDHGRLHYLLSPRAFILGSWHHVVGVYDGDVQRLFVDGEEVASAEVTKGPVAYAESIRLVVGAYRDSNEQHLLRGALGVVSYEEGVLSTQEVVELERRARPRFPAVEAWLMDHASRGWACYRGNVGRTGATAEPFGADLRLAWRHHLSPPAPAWPPPARGSYWQNLTSIAPRVVDDHAMHPVIAEGCVLLASSSDLSLRCLELDTGALRWRWISEAPLRYAPAVVQGRVLVGGDDGVVRCFALADGTLEWDRRVAPSDDDESHLLLPGNGRLVSLHPIRTGLLVQGDRVFATAGLFPSQGVFAAALSLKDGAVHWRASLGEHSPQGYLLATDRLLIVPGGRANPISLELETGRRGPSFDGVGGTYAVLCEDTLVAGRGNDGSFVRSAANSGSKLVQSRGELLAVSATHSFTAGEGQVRALDRARLAELSAQLRTLEDEGRDDAAARQQKARLRRQIEACVLWQRQVDDVHELIAAGDELLVGRTGALERWSVRTGKSQRLAEVDGKVLGLASAEGAVIATTDRGELLAFLPRERRGVKNVESAQPPLPSGDGAEVAAVSDALEGFELRRGFAVVLTGAAPAGGDGPAGLAVVDALLDASEFQVALVVDGEPSAVEWREVFADVPRRADRVSVHALRDGGRLPFVDHIGTVVLDLDTMLPREELERVTTPGRGVVRRGSVQWTRPPIPGAGAWTHQYADLENTACGGDAHTDSRLALQWFGGPGPERMIDRHLRGPPPLAAGGRVFMMAENRVIGVDAYNGVELWDTELPEAQRYSMPYDCGSAACDARQVLAAVDARLWLLDAATGEKERELALPRSLRQGHHWGYVGLDGDTLFGSAMLPTAPRTDPGRHLSDQTYRSQVPLVTSRAFFRVDRTSGRVAWTRREGLIVHPTIAIDAQRVYFVEARAPACRSHEVGRLPLVDLIAEDAWLVALDRETGAVAWEQRLELPRCRNVLYVSVAGPRLCLVGSWDGANRDARYQVRVLDVETGALQWEGEHANLNPGQLYHGEQVHHPVVLGDTLVAEPFLYDLTSGEVVNADAPIKRPGHSCGTMSGSKHCLFFRAGNPTVLDLARSAGDERRMQRLSPSRVGCWINILPVQGLVLIPEASASCVCHYALQTSMAFRPKRQ